MLTLPLRTVRLLPLIPGRVAKPADPLKARAMAARTRIGFRAKAVAHFPMFAPILLAPVIAIRDSGEQYSEHKRGDQAALAFGVVSEMTGRGTGLLAGRRGHRRPHVRSRTHSGEPGYRCHGLAFTCMSAAVRSRG